MKPKKIREGGFYQRIEPEPPKDKCSECGRPIYSFQRDGKCLRCTFGHKDDDSRQAADRPF